MNLKKTVFLSLLFMFIGCEERENNDGDVNVDDNSGASSLVNIPSSIVNFSYKIFGQAYVDEITAINIDITALDYKDSIILKYKTNVADDLLFGDGQLQEFIINPLIDGRYPSQQINIIPKREGRLFLLVSGELLMDDEVITKVTSIPIDVERKNSN